MKRISFSTLSGLLLISLGMADMLGWGLQIPRLITVLPNYINMVFNTGLSFAAAGFALFIPNYKPAYQNPIRVFFGIIILAISSITLCEYAIPNFSNIDQLFVKVWLFDQNPFPGRMAVNTAIAFAMTGVTFVLFPYSAQRSIDWIIQIFIFLITLLGVMAMLGYLLKLEFLYSWYQYTRMAIHTSLGFSMLGLGLISAWKNNHCFNVSSEIDDIKIVLLNAIILIAIAIISACAGISLFSKYNEEITNKFFQEILQNKINMFQNALKKPFMEMKQIQENFRLKNLDQKPLNFASILSKMKDTHYSAIQMRDNQGNILYSQGKLSVLSGSMIPLKMPFQAALVWNNNFLLHMTGQLFSENKPIGKFSVVWLLESITELESVDDFFICSDVTPLNCLPRETAYQNRHLVFTETMQQRIIQAITKNKQGILIGNNRKNQQGLLAFRPIESLGLFFLDRSNITQLYQPARERLYRTIFLVSIIIGIGILLLYWQVLPLLRQLVRTKQEALANSIRLRAIFDHASEGVIIINAEGIIEAFNLAASKMFGYTEIEMVGKNLESLIPQDLRERHKAGMKRYLQTRDSTIVNKHSVEIPGLHKNNKPFPMELAITEMQIDKEIKFIGMMHDISERKINEAKIAESETRFRSAFDYSPIGIALFSLEGQCLKVNPSLCDMLGYKESELLNMDFQTITYPEDLENDLDYIKQLSDRKIPSYQIEKRYIRKNKQNIWVLLTRALICNDAGTPLYYINQVQDVHDKKKADEDLSFKAYNDTLTGLFNRNQLENSLDLTISSALRLQHQFAIFYIDLDNFKQVNDSLGHNAGDELLKIMGERLKNNIRKTDIAARIGGDEFVLVLNGTDNPEIAASFAEKILNIISQPVTIKEHQLFITASIGISFYPGNGLDYKSLVKSADLALYKAKENKRNNYQFCTEKLNEETQGKIAFKHALKKSIENQDFFLVFLPRIDFKNQITGFEALLRWKNEQYRDVSPDKIIPNAEEIGMINELGNWIIREASEQFLHWKQVEKSPLKMIIKISPRYYLQTDFADTILEILTSIDLSPHYLEVEINENLIMQDPDYSIKVINTLKNHGIQIIIDNFGTGYSSLSLLSQFRVDSIKISRKFIQDIATNYQHRKLITAMIALTKKLHIKIIAEGIENKKQHDLLLQLGCDEFQGYYISHPLIAEKVPQFLKNYRTQSSNAGKSS